MRHYLPLVAAIVGVTEAAVLPTVGAVLGDDSTTWSLQAGGATAEAYVNGLELYLVELEAGAVLDNGQPSPIGNFMARQVLRALLVLDVMLAIVQSLEYLNGFGPPDTGDDFRGGYAAFSSNVFSLMHNASPEPGQWSGSSAQDYEHLIEDQQARIAKIPAADRLIADTLADQAFQVTQTRQGLAGARIAVIGATMVAGALYQAYYVAYMEADFAIAQGIAMILDKYVVYLASAVAVTALGLITTVVVEGALNVTAFNDAKNSYKSACTAAGFPSDSAGRLSEAASHSR